MAASAEAPLYPISLLLRLRARGAVGMVREQACQWALTQKRTLRGAAHLRWVIFVSLDGSERGGALVSDVVVEETASEGGIGMVREQACQRALTGKQTLLGGGALKRGLTALPLSASHSLVMPSAV